MPGPNPWNRTPYARAIVNRPPPPEVRRVPPQIRVDAAFGRLYVSGPASTGLAGLAGAAFNAARSAYELSLTLETMRAIKATLGLTSQQLAGMCSEAVLRWARATGASDAVVTDLHRRLATGWRRDFIWRDTTGANRAPFDHQKVMATVAYELDGCALIADMGTAKTRAALEAMQLKFTSGALDQFLVVCPKGVMKTWVDEARMWAPALTVVRLQGKVTDRIATMTRTAQRGVVFVLNYEAAARVARCVTSLAGRRRFGLICDEMHKAKNPQAQVTKTIMQWAPLIPWRLGMTGSPMANTSADIWSQWYIIDLGATFGANFVQYKREFFTSNPYTFELRPKDGANDEIGLRMRRRGVRYRKEDCLDLPPKIYTTREVEMTADQRRMYNEMRDLLVARIRAADAGEAVDINEWEAYGLDAVPERTGAGSLAIAANQLVAMMRLTQITSGFLVDEHEALRRFDPNPKLDACEEIVRENIDAQSIIVWARYRADADALLARCRDLNPVTIRGGQTDRERDAAEQAFQQGAARLLVGQPGAGGVGLNLQRGSLAIYYSQDYNLIHRMQSEDRCHRAGSEIHQHVTYIDLVCSETIDSVVRGALIDKRNLSEVVVDLRHALGVD